MSELPLAPGVYPATRTRAAELARARTDVAGFVGFEPRVRDAGSAVVGAGHRFQVDVSAFQVLMGERRLRVLAQRLVLSANDLAIPMGVGGSLCFSVVAVPDGGVAALRVIPGTAVGDLRALTPEDPIIRGVVGATWARVVDVEVRRLATGFVGVSVVPRLPPQRCRDHAEYGAWFGLSDEEDGYELGRAVRAYFANGGDACWVMPTPRPTPGDPEGLRRALEDMVGLPGASEREATGFERLLLVEEVAVVDVPDLYARRAFADPRSVPIPPPALDVCFRPCEPTALPAVATGPAVPGDPIFAENQILQAQRRLMGRAAALRWRVQLLVAAPVEFDPAVGAWRSPGHERAAAWRAALEGATDGAGAAATAFYHPWLLAADRIGGAVRELPPCAFAAGIIARRDLARGPQVAPANELVHGAVGLARPVDDAANGALYATPTHVNLFRAFAGRGIQLWGARTLSTDRWMRHLPIRRGLSGIERQLAAACTPLVFEPNTPTLWFQMTQIALGVLFALHQRGVLRGDSPDESFTVRCDETNNPPDQVELGRVVCDIGVAIAAPATFVQLRLTRTEATIALEEA